MKLFFLIKPYSHDLFLLHVLYQWYYGEWQNVYINLQRLYLQLFAACLSLCYFVAGCFKVCCHGFRFDALQCQGWAATYPIISFLSWLINMEQFWKTKHPPPLHNCISILTPNKPSMLYINESNSCEAKHFQRIVLSE